MSSNSKLIFDSYCTLTGACPLYQQSWMCDETIFRILNTHYPHLKNAFNFTREGLNRSISAKAGPCTGQNPYGIYWATFSTDCPYSGVFRKVSYYFRQSVRCPAGSRPLIIFGQDESIFNQFSHSGRQWLGPLGQRSIMPKSAGMGVMLSAFQSRDVSARIFDCYFHILIALNHLMFIVVRHSLAGVYK